MADEVKELGYETKQKTEKFILKVMNEQLPRQICGFALRTASELLPANFIATTFDDLFEQTKAIPWEQYLSVDAAFPVQGNQLNPHYLVFRIAKRSLKKRLLND